MTFEFFSYLSKTLGDSQFTQESIMEDEYATVLDHAEPERFRLTFNLLYHSGIRSHEIFPCVSQTYADPSLPKCLIPISTFQKPIVLNGLGRLLINRCTVLL